ncbi:MAG TPA: ABC transporter ATP-binding protein [Xanthobacteraceae bacterium]|nr:ABC transporter ATP-binding protein [Xanthobacteraceae bacterium]
MNKHLTDVMRDTQAVTAISPKDALLVVSDVHKNYGARQEVAVLGGITFSVGKGEFVSVVGPSGCGKTTLLLSLSGLMRPDRGAVALDGKVIGDGTPDGVAIVFQDYSRSLFPWKTVRANVIFGMRRLSNLSRGDKRKQADELLAAVGLAGFEDRYPWQLSGGMQQRVAIARGLASRSKLLLLDEPLAAVDAQTRADLQDLLLDLAKRFEQTCLLVTHDVDEAVYMADRVIVLSKRPTHVIEEIDVALPNPRDQIETREEKAYLEIRHEVLSRIRLMRGSPAAQH